MSDESLFIDANILVYAHDKDARVEHETAKTLIRELWSGIRLPSISVQVLQEFYVNLLRKGVSEDEASGAVHDYLNWHVVDNDRSLLTSGIEERRRYKISFWDGLILAAARRAGANVLWSEDFNAGQNYDGVLAVNPLLRKKQE
ncbi:MAG TPA: PIN domain-containing protein [Vicinamibacteria bacterium]|nr:PIN domain-containing protein [Vicinamibacteria bacterium]